MPCSGINNASTATSPSKPSSGRRWNIRASAISTMIATAILASPSAAMGTIRAPAMPASTARRIRQEARPNQRTVLLRNGVEVAATESHAYPERDVGASPCGSNWNCAKKARPSNSGWAANGVELYRSGAASPAACRPSGRRITASRSPSPVHFANPAQLRSEAQVIIDNPWYPEWTNVGTPLTLDFPESWATSGKPVTLKAKDAAGAGGRGRGGDDAREDGHLHADNRPANTGTRSAPRMAQPIAALPSLRAHLQSRAGTR